MKIIRDDKRIKRLGRISQGLTLTGLGVLAASFILSLIDPVRYGWVQIVGLGLGWFISQIAIYMAHRFFREPRMDVVLDETLGRTVPNGRMYHFVLPAPHVLLTEAGPIVLVTQYQHGRISIDEKGRWRQKGVGLLRKWFAQESVGNPTKLAEARIGAMANFIRKNAPEVDEVPLAAAIVFTSDKAKVGDLSSSPIKALHAKKLRPFVKKNIKKRMPAEDYAALRRAFDEAAGHLVEEAA